jgi:hypothetical protein
MSSPLFFELYFDTRSAGQNRASRRPWAILISLKKHTDNGLYRYFRRTNAALPWLPGENFQSLSPHSQSAFTRYNLLS